MYTFLKITSNLVAFLPPGVVIALAHSLGFFAFDILQIKRKLVLKNLDIAFGDRYTQKEKMRIARRSIYHFLLTIFENLRSIRYPLDQDVRFSGEHYVKEALAGQQGAFLLCSHMANWEATGAAISNKICPAHVFVKKVGSPSLNQFVEEIRQKNGFLIISRKKAGDGTRKLISILKNNQIIGFVFDQAKPAAPRVPLFSQTAKTNPALAKLRQKYPVPVIPCYTVREGLNKHHIIFLPPLQLEGKAEEDNTEAFTLRFNQAMETIVESNPEQYFWLHNRWK